jgi:hypothetical protein
MLPSIRLIAATFFCGFIVVFAGLRLAASLNDIHEGLPVMAAHAAPIRAAPIADPALRRGRTDVPVMYELRFVASNSTLTPTLVNFTPPPAPPLDITPPAIERVTKEELPAPAGSIVASAKDEPPPTSAEPPKPTAEQPAAAPAASAAGGQSDTPSEF